MKNEKSGSSDDESGDEEPTIKDALSYLSKAVSKKRALISCIARQLQEIFYSGLPVDSYFEINP